MLRDQPKSSTVITPEDGFVPELYLSTYVHEQLSALHLASGKSCEPNHISRLKESLRDVYNNLGTLRDMIRVVNGKTVVLIKATDELHSKVAGLTKYLKTMNRDLQTWKTVLNRQFLKLRCTDSMLHEFTSKHS